MKRSIVDHILIFIIFSLLACQDSADKKIEETPTNPALNETVGARIPNTLAEEWLGYYNKKYSQAGRTNSSVYSIDPSRLNALLNSSANLIGLVFHHAIDEMGIRHIIVIPLDATQQLWANDSRMLVDANTNTVIEQSIARRWTENYRNKYPNDVRSHFFGLNIFNEIRGIRNLNELEIKQAINGEDIPQLLLYAWSSEGGSNGKLKGEPDVYDRSSGCPFSCPPPSP